MTSPRLNSSVSSLASRFALALILPSIAGLACSPPADTGETPATVSPTVVPSSVASTPVVPAGTMPAPTAAVTAAAPVVGEGGGVILGTAMGGGTGTTGFKPSEKVDLLFVVDNSLSMGDKQAVFKKAVPDLITYLANPPCVDKAQVFVNPVDGKCPIDTAFVFKPVKDIHIGVITSSLGPRGTLPDETPGGCSDVPGENDKGYLLGLMRGDALKATTYQQQGFLAWDPDQKLQPPGEANLDSLIANFQAQVEAVGEHGCGFEAPLEAAYRFLAEPDPYESVNRVACAGQAATDPPLCAEKVGIDQNLLTQRAQFIRPDSVVVAMFLTDENDCSIRTQGQGFYAMRANPLGNGTSACDTNPNDACCYSCNGAPPATCATPVASNGCGAGVSHDLPESLNIRCYNQKGRFGVDFLRATNFYSAAYMKPQLADRANMAVDNPLLSPERGPEKVFVVGILGVPWQDTATPETINDPNDLRLLRNKDINWANFLTTDGNPALDPFNRETVDQRAGTSPVSGVTLTPPGTWNAVNGFERPLVIGDQLDDDLQYGCIFPLDTPRECSTAPEDTYCDCNKGVEEGGTPFDYTLNNPLCVAPGTAAGATPTYGTLQYSAKAYPSPRMLEVLKEVGNQGLVASICPRQTLDPNKPDYGYRPVIRALLLNAATQLPR